MFSRNFVNASTYGYRFCRLISSSRSLGMYIFAFIVTTSNICAFAKAQYDVAIVGGGPGGYVAAIKAAQLGLKV
jgi:NADPH-dependent 2,4-dienoyl-CoA reductase/sulfur reductase-like enzyme